jgi:hypothetical protein
MNQPGERPLSGGNSTSVVRVGDTVRRATGPWGPAVHGLLRHLEEQGFDGAPRFLGLDDRGWEVLTFLDGEVGGYPLPEGLWSDEALAGAARLIRRYHDATVGYVPPEGAVWRLPIPGGPQEVICHNDLAPYNVVYRRGEPTGIIDFDTATPGPRVWDLAYAAYCFVPLCRPDHARSLGFGDLDDVGRRLRLFCDVYRLDARARGSLPAAIIRRLEALCSYMLTSAASGEVWAAAVISEGHLDGYRRDIEYLLGSRLPDDPET